MGALFTLFKMRKSLGEGLRRAIGDVRKPPVQVWFRLHALKKTYLLHG